MKKRTRREKRVRKALNQINGWRADIKKKNTKSKKRKTNELQKEVGRKWKILKYTKIEKWRIGKEVRRWMELDSEWQQKINVKEKEEREDGSNLGTEERSCHEGRNKWNY